jgi:ribonuclease HI
MKYCVIKKESSQKIYTVGDCNVEFMRFDTLEQAEQYLGNGEITVPGNINVYTDGACSNNGKASAKAGIGVYFGDGDERNVSRKIDGAQTNNRAELLAIIEVFKILCDDISPSSPPLGVGGKKKSITIYSDSKYSINSLTCWGENWEKNNWTKKNKSPILNLEIIKEGYYNLKKYKNIELKYVPAHTENKDTHSIGNAGADNLATLSIK